MPRANSPDKPDQQRTAKVLRSLEELSSQEYTILKISEPISSVVSSADPNNSNNNNKEPGANVARTSDVSTSSLDTPTPASLEADLAHYRELFAKLRFSYVEQVTKEKFIRAIVGDPPLIVTPQENADLEASNAAAKAALKALKTEVAATVSDLGTRGRDLAARYDALRADAGLLAELPGKIAALEARVAELRAEQQQQHHHRRQDSPGPGKNRPDKPEMNLPLGKTLALVESKRQELAALSRQAELLGGQVPRKRKEAERLGAEVAALENRRANSAAAAAEAKRRREEKGSAAPQEQGGGGGGFEDELEARGRWYRASEAVLRRALDLDVQG